METNKPEIVFKAGPVRAAVWKNTTERGSYYSVTLERSYKKNDVWAHTSQLRINDLPKAVIALNKAFEYLLQARDVKED